MQFSMKYAVAAAVIAVTGAVLYGFFSQSEEVRPGQAVEILESNHIPATAPTPEYNSNPPTSGPHSSPVKNSFYSGGVKEAGAVHNLEHGMIWITYKNVDGDTVRRLRKIAQRFAGSVFLSLRSANDSPIALVSWGRIMKMDSYDEQRILDFITKNKNKSPEPLAR